MNKRDAYQTAYRFIRCMIKPRLRKHNVHRIYRDWIKDLPIKAVMAARDSMLARDDLTVMQKQSIRTMYKPFWDHVGRNIKFTDYEGYAAWYLKNRAIGDQVLHPRDTMQLYDVADEIVTVYSPANNRETADIPREYIEFADVNTDPNGFTVGQTVTVADYDGYREWHAEPFGNEPAFKRDDTLTIRSLSPDIIMAYAENACLTLAIPRKFFQAGG